MNCLAHSSHTILKDMFTTSSKMPDCYGYVRYPYECTYLRFPWHYFHVVLRSKFTALSRVRGELMESTNTFQICRHKSSLPGEAFCFPLVRTFTRMDCAIKISLQIRQPLCRSGEEQGSQMLACWQDGAWDTLLDLMVSFSCKIHDIAENFLIIIFYCTQCTWNGYWKRENVALQLEQWMEVYCGGRMRMKFCVIFRKN